MDDMNIGPSGIGYGNMTAKMMEEMMRNQPKEPESYTITLSDGTTIENLQLSGSCFVTKQEITKEMFTGKLHNVEILGVGGDITYPFEGFHDYMDLSQIQHDIQNNLYYFSLIDVGKRERQLREMFSNVDYLLMLYDE